MINEIFINAVANIISGATINSSNDVIKKIITQRKGVTDTNYNVYCVSGPYENVLNKYVDEHNGGFEYVPVDKRVYISISSTDDAKLHSTVLFYRRKDNPDKLVANNLGSLVRDVNSNKIIVAFDRSVVDINSIFVLDLDVRYENGSYTIDGYRLINRRENFELDQSTDMISQSVNEILTKVSGKKSLDYYMLSFENEIALLFDL